MPAILKMRRLFIRPGLCGLLALGLVLPAAAPAGVYVTEASGIRWNDVGGIRWNDVGGIRWNDVGGIRWNDVGGIRWNDVGGVLFTDASGIRWNDVGGIRWNDVGGLAFDDALATGGVSLDLELLSLVSTLPDTSSINVIVTYRAAPTPADLADLQALGIPGGTLFRQLPMVVVNATKNQIAAMAALPAVRSVFANRTLSFFDATSRALIGATEAGTDPALAAPGGGPLTGEGVTIAVLDSGVDGTHPDLPSGSKVLENVRLAGAVGTGPGFMPPAYVEGQANSDLVLGHGTFVASVAAGSGAASSGLYKGVAPGAGILALSAGDLYIIHVLEGFDYILDNAVRFGVGVVNCSWGTTGFFDPDDPVNVATRILHDAGIVVVFAAGNHGPSPDTMNPYAIAPWVIGVGSTSGGGALSPFSSRGIFEELIVHPVLVAPGEGIVAAKPAGLAAVAGVAGAVQPPSSLPAGLADLYTTASGTSFAAPHVAGVVALLRQMDPTLGPEAIKRLLQATATPMLRHDRSQVGAGRLDAWAALTQALDESRPFGTHHATWLDQRPYRVVHAPAVEEALVLPAGGTVRVAAAPGAGALSWQATLAWDGPLSDLDAVARTPGGAVLARGESSRGAALFGGVEGVHLLGSPPAELDLDIFFKDGTAVGDQPFLLRRETSGAEVTAYTDVAGLPAAERAMVTGAVSRRLMLGRGSLFDPASGLTRGELARSLALAAGAPQRIPAAATFSDVPATHPAHPYVESIAGARARVSLMNPDSGGGFGADRDVVRLDFAVALVKAAGRGAEAAARAGEPLGLKDESQIPFALKGYVAVAVERGLINLIPGPDGTRFRANWKVTRLEAAGFLQTLLAQP